MSTQESRGIDMTETVFLSPLICRIMIASVRWAPSAHWDGSDALVRESVPRTRMLVAAS